MVAEAYERKVDFPTPASPRSRMGTTGGSAMAGDVMVRI
jgi:hypothetical protein